MARILITSALPYINGVKHLGNLAGSMLPADVYARAMRLLGHEVLYICATDEHGTPAELAAAEAGLEVADYCAKMHEAQKASGDNFKLSYDYFGAAMNRRAVINVIIVDACSTLLISLIPIRLSLGLKMLRCATPIIYT